MRTIKLANNAVHQVSWCGGADGFFHMELEDAQNVVDVANEFAVAENTAHIDSMYDGEIIETYVGYTELIMVKKDAYTGFITVTLRKEG